MDGYSFYDGYCFQLFPETKTWNDAKQTCIDHHGHLITMDSAEKTQSIQSYLSWLQTETPGKFLLLYSKLIAYPSIFTEWNWLTHLAHCDITMDTGYLGESF